MKNESHYTYKYRFGFGQVLNFLIGFGLLGSSLFLLVRFTVDNTLIVVASFLAVVGLPPIFITINYLIRSIDYEIRIDHDKGILEITKKKVKQACNLKDIKSVDIQKQKNMGLYRFDFDFVKYTFEDGKYCIVTNMMTNDYYIPVGLEPKIKRTIFPIIWRKTNV